MRESSRDKGYVLSAGTLLHSSYRIDRVLGEGGFAVIYLCTNIRTGSTAAIKEYFPSGLAKREYQQDLFCVQPYRQCTTEFEKGYRHFLEEARILRECQNLQGIVTVHDLFEENQTAYIVMEYIEGPTLEQYVLANGPMSAQETIDLILPLIRSLEYVHKKGLIHRDISPDNLILGMDNRLHLIDFGAAGMKQSYNKDNQTVILKKGFAPPEQYLASGNIGAWSDIYALCATMYFAISGHAPMAAIDRLQRDDLQPLTSYGDIPAQTAAVIERGLSLHQADRYKTMEKLQSALEHPETAEEALENSRTLLDPALPAEKQQLFAAHAPEPESRFRKNRIVRTGGIFLFVVVTAAIVWYLSAGRNNNGTPLASAVPTYSAASSAIPASPETTYAAPKLCTMTRVTGMKLSRAKKRIRSVDPSIRIRITKQYSSSAAKGRVLSQSIQKGTVFNAGTVSQMTLIVSRGKAPATPKPVVTSPAVTRSTGSDSHNTAKTKSNSKTTATAKPRSQKAGDFQVKNKPSKDSFEIE